MKKIRMKNESLVRVFNLLQSASLKNRASLGKIKFMKKLQEKEQDLTEAKNIIQKNYFKLDENGEFVIEGDHYVMKDEITEDQKKEFAAKLEELLFEEFEISFVEYSDKYEAMFEALEKLDKELVGEEALAYFDLMEAYESENKKGEKQHD